MRFDDLHTKSRLSTATHRDADGKVIEGERTNLLDNAKGFDNAAWLVVEEENP